MLYEYDLITSYAQGEVIFLAGKTDYHELVIHSETPLNLPEPHLAPLLKPFVFFTDNPSYMLKLMGLKVFYFIARVRPYYSITHNMIVLALFIPRYMLTLWTLFSNSALGRGTKSFFMVYVLGTLGTISLTIVDWDGRFFLPLIPLLFLLFGAGSYRLLLRIRPYFSAHFKGLSSKF